MSFSHMRIYLANMSLAISLKMNTRKTKLSIYYSQVVKCMDQIIRKSRGKNVKGKGRQPGKNSAGHKASQ
jgi:hypothetical protein